MLCYYRERKYVCGDYMDVQIYPVYRKAGTRRSKAKPTSEVQQRLNDENAKRAFVRLVHANFSRHDIALHLTYDEFSLPADELTAKKDVQEFLRRVRRIYKKLGIELKYVWVCEKGERSNRVHHHLILSAGASRDVLEALWQKGYANSKRLRFTENGISGLAVYMTKQKLFFKRWNASKNLVRPVTEVNDYRYSAKKVRKLFSFAEYPAKFSDFYPGYACPGIEGCFASINPQNRGYYISLQMYDISRFKAGGGFNE